MTTTFEEAKKCPKCKQPGQDRKTIKQRNSHGKPVETHLIYCVTQVCPWYDTPWQVTINPDGTIPEPYSQLGEKQFPRLSQESRSRIEDNIKAQLEAETHPGGEVRNPHSRR